MNRLFVLLIVLILISPFSIAEEISEADSGSYVLLGRDNVPVDMFYRLSKSGDKWVMDGKKAGDS